MLKHSNEFMNIFKEYNNSNTNHNNNSLDNVSISRDKKIKSKINRESDKIIKEIINVIAEKLHNTPTVSKKSYLDGNVVQLYLQNPRVFWRRINQSNNKNDLNMMLIELLTNNCVSAKCKNCKVNN